MRWGIGALVAFAATCAFVPSAWGVSNTGTEFWAVDTDNCCLGSVGVFGIAVANPGSSAASVTIRENSTTVATATVPAGAVHTFQLPRHKLTGTTRSMTGAYRISSDAPISAYQFNPLAQAFTNDASLLLPTAALGTAYRVSSYPSPFGGAPYGSLLAVVGTQPGATAVEVKVAADTMAGAGIPATPAGGTISLSLAEGEAVQIEAPAGRDLTGSSVTSDKPVAVIGGAGCVQVPVGALACDHLEEQMFPETTWGKSVPMCEAPELPAAAERVRIIAQADETTFTSNPAVPGLSGTLNAGQMKEVVVPDDVVITADKPILVVQYLQGAGITGKGDPSMLQGVPAAQFRRAYQFLTPPNYTEDWVVIAAPTDTAVTVDGNQIPAAQFDAIADTGLSCAKVPLPKDGAHTVTADKKVGITVYSFEGYGSIAYPGGLELEDIVSCERGLKILRDTPAGGLVSRTVRDQVVPVVNGVDPAAGALVSQVNCDVVATVVEQGTVDPITDTLDSDPSR